MIYSHMMFPSSIRFCENIGTVVHKVPRLPVEVDGKKANPESVRDFNGKPLHSVLDDTAGSQPVLKIFTELEQSKRLARHILDYHLAQNSSATVSAANGCMRLYQHINFEGCCWHLNENDSLVVPDYRSLLTCGFLLWGWKPAHDEISSIELRFSRRVIVFYEDINLQGSSNIVVGPTNISDLRVSGWNDRISSHEVLE